MSLLYYSICIKLNSENNKKEVNFLSIVHIVYFISFTFEKNVRVNRKMERKSRLL